MSGAENGGAEMSVDATGGMVTGVDASTGAATGGASFFFTDTATTEIYTRKDTLSLHDALPISAGLDRVGAARRDRQPAEHRAGVDEAPSEGERLVEERAHVRARRLTRLLVPLEAEHFVGVDLQRQGRQDARIGGELRAQALHLRGLRPRTTSRMRRMCSGFEPQHAPTMSQPASRSAGYSRAISSGPSSYVTVSPVVTGRPAFG